MTQRPRAFVSQGDGVTGTVTRFAITACVLDSVHRTATLTLRLDWELQEDAGTAGMSPALRAPWRVTFTRCDPSGTVQTLAEVDVASHEGLFDNVHPRGRRRRCHVEVPVRVPLAPPPILEATIRRVADTLRSPSSDLLGYADAPELEVAPGSIAPEALRWVQTTLLAPGSTDPWDPFGLPIEPPSASTDTDPWDPLDATFGLPSASTGTDPLGFEPPSASTETPAAGGSHQKGDVAVFCPPIVGRASVFLVQVLLYPPDRSAEAREQAREADAAAERRGVLTLPPDLTPGIVLDLRLEMPGLRIDEPDAAMVWTGRTTAAQFEVVVPAEAPIGNVIGRVRLSVAGVPIGTLRFQVLVSTETASHPPRDANAEVKRYRRAFVSYSSSDRAEVLRRVQAFRIAGISVFQDVLELEPGERWERELYREIDRSDVMLLFWSSAAAASPWVAKEIDYALALKQGHDDRPPDIAPVPIEGPPIPPPPERLRHLHFNDALLAHIATAQTPPKG